MTYDQAASRGATTVIALVDAMTYDQAASRGATTVIALVDAMTGSKH